MTPMKLMYDEGSKYIEVYGSDMLWDAFTVGKDVQENPNVDHEYVWILRKAGTYLLSLKEKRRTRTILDNFYNDPECKFFYVKNPQLSLGSGGQFEEITKEKAWELMS